ncbi:MAG: AIPR family protein [Comamonas sp.]|uniref:Abortive phage resistance protein n=1 Tax=Comamonas testosteroni TK102 TaxID=1392005 RepID=A0A076PHM0_COMTE|nr:MULTISPECIES: AIPR family protein [Comamonas]AIJ45068.1 abortive phage resistance protein [Comamonas testosteroni TK102]MDN5506548.1 AIPR family protein [Comamonas sp.]MDN5535673.1 AIPR family protein [Comamonas sp.]MPS88250.1 abortive phage resistance protein [Comamonas sp.]
MAALEPHYLAILKTVLATRFVPYLPPLLGKVSAADQAAKQLSRAFSAFVLHKLLDITPQAAAVSVVDDYQDKGLDAIHYDATTETLYLLQTKLKESEQFKQEDALPFCEGIRLLLKQDFGAFNANVQARKPDIESALDSCSHIKLVVPFTGDGISKTASDALQALLGDEDLDEERLVKQVEYYTASEITRDLLAEQAYAQVHAEIALQKHEKVEHPRSTYYGVARLGDLVTLHQTHGKALYERNIRYFLGSSKSDVNKAIKTTLHDAPGDFFYLNNGVTAVCDLIEPKATKNGAKKFKVRGLSIINGAQTVASAAEFVRQHPGRNIDDAKVMLTLIKAPADGPFGKRVTKARNHQNPVQTANFASLDENQERLRQEIAHLGFEYHYRPEALATGPTAITLDEALRALASQQHDPRYAVWLKSDPARLAKPDSAEYQALFANTLTGAALVNAVLCHRAIRALVVDYELRAPARSQERLIYRHGIHVITAVMMKRLRNRIGAAAVVNVPAINALLSQADTLDQLRQQAFSLGQKRLTFEGPLAYFRNQSNVTAFLADLMETHFALTADQAIAPLRNIQTAADIYPRKRLLDYLSSRAPQL